MKFSLTSKTFYQQGFSSLQLCFNILAYRVLSLAEALNKSYGALANHRTRCE